MIGTTVDAMSYTPAEISQRTFMLIARGHLGIQRPSGRSHLTWVRTRTRHVLIGRNEPWSQVVVIHWLLISHLYKGMYFSSITLLRQFGKLSHLTPTTSGKCPSHDILHNSYGTAEQTFLARER